MYTVLRFWNIPDDTSMVNLGQQLNEVSEGIYERPDRRPNRISLSVTAVQDWNLHQDEIRVTILKFEEIITSVHRTGIGVGIDIAIEEKDFLNRWRTTLRFGHELLKLLSKNNVEIALTIYGGGPSDSDGLKFGQ